MIGPFTKTVVRLLFTFTTRSSTNRRSQVWLQKYLDLARGLSPDAGQLSVEVPPMRGIDENMRRWSFFMILEHNTIVNRSITATVSQLARGEPLSGAATIDPKTDVMPSSSADHAQLEPFQDSIIQHARVVAGLGGLRGTQTSPHPVFGDFDAHKWNCMFSFHLGLHYTQAAYVARVAKAEQGSGGNP